METQRKELRSLADKLKGYEEQNTWLTEEMDDTRAEVRCWTREKIKHEKLLDKALGHRETVKSLPQAKLGGSDSELESHEAKRVRSGIRQTGHPLSGGASLSAPETEVNYDKPWFEFHSERKDWYCNLCKCWATEAHVLSAKHVRRAEDPLWYGFGAEPGEEDRKYGQPWFVKKQGDWYCLLCYAYATQDHLDSDKHKRREQFPESYGAFGEAASSRRHPGRRSQSARRVSDQKSDSCS